MINEGVNEGVAHCPIRQRNPNGVLQEENHAGAKVGKKTDIDEIYNKIKGMDIVENIRYASESEL